MEFEAIIENMLVFIFMQIFCLKIFVLCFCSRMVFDFLSDFITR